MNSSTVSAMPGAGPVPGAAQNTELLLHPLREPPPPQWWPPAPGWWLLAICSLVLLAWLIRRAISHWRSRRYRRLALRELALIRTQYPATTAALTLVGECNTLLKRAALQCWPASEVAGLNGQQWLDFLNRTANAGTRVNGGGNALFAAVHADLPYRAQVSAEQAQSYAEASAQWLRRHRPPARAHRVSADGSRHD